MQECENQPNIRPLPSPQAFPGEMLAPNVGTPPSPPLNNARFEEIQTENTAYLNENNVFIETKLFRSSKLKSCPTQENQSPCNIS
jgi:hypothetical protein